MRKILTIFKNLISWILKLPKNSKKWTKDFVYITRYLLKDFFAFMVLITFYLVDNLIITKLVTAKLLPYAFASKIVGNFYNIYTKALSKLNKGTLGSISRLDLIHLSIRNMRVKKVRTLITIGGVSIGIGAIVFLVSLGYGVQRLVVTRVARLEELKQTDVLTQPGSKIVINDKTLADVKSFTDVVDVYPLIAAVGRVNYQNSVSDMAVYGVTTGYLEKSAIKPIKGKVFESYDLSIKPAFNSTAKNLNYLDQNVQGAKDVRANVNYGESISPIQFNIEPETWLRVRVGPSTNSRGIGYTKRFDHTLQGTKYFGSSYTGTDAGKYATDSEGNELGLWIKSKVYIWTQEGNEYIPVQDENGEHLQTEGYFAYIGVLEQNNVLGVSSTTEVLAAEDDATTVVSTAPSDPLSAIQIDPNSDWVELSLGEDTVDTSVTKVALSSQSIKQAVVNRAMIKLLGINEDEAVGKTFSASFVVPSYLLENATQRVESESADYTIVGVTPDDVSPVFYVPFVDLRSLGIVNFSQFKVLSSEPSSLDKVRKQIEALGYSTTSVADTVDQINSLFATIRLVLGVMGMIALAVAALGMFNTLTISLLERSREIGLMKAMGMTTEEVQQLFLTESILMGFCAGFGGLFTGFAIGKLLGLFLTFLSVFKGQGFIDVSLIPLPFVLLIIFLSFLVGLLTGIYPAKRSKKISALDALRYE